MACLLGIAMLPMFVEGINLMWHFGSYNGYTLRNGFDCIYTALHGRVLCTENVCGYAA